MLIISAWPEPGSWNSLDTRRTGLIHANNWISTICFSYTLTSPTRSRVGFIIWLQGPTYAYVSREKHPTSRVSIGEGIIIWKKKTYITYTNDIYSVYQSIRQVIVNKPSRMAKKNIEKSGVIKQMVFPSKGLILIESKNITPNIFFFALNCILFFSLLYIRAPNERTDPKTWFVSIISGRCLFSWNVLKKFNLRVCREIFEVAKISCNLWHRIDFHYRWWCAKLNPYLVFGNYTRSWFVWFFHFGFFRFGFPHSLCTVEKPRGPGAGGLFSSANAFLLYFIFSRHMSFLRVSYQRFH